MKELSMNGYQMLVPWWKTNLHLHSCILAGQLERECRGKFMAVLNTTLCPPRLLLQVDIYKPYIVWDFPKYQQLFLDQWRVLICILSTFLPTSTLFHQGEYTRRDENDNWIRTMSLGLRNVLYLFRKIKKKMPIQKKGQERTYSETNFYYQNLRW